MAHPYAKFKQQHLVRDTFSEPVDFLFHTQRAYVYDCITYMATSCDLLPSS